MWREQGRQGQRRSVQGYGKGELIHSLTGRVGFG